MTLRVCTNFATANGSLLSEDERMINLDRDIRDSTGDRWYWHIRLISPIDKTISVRMARPMLLGQFGPAVSEGGPYEWLQTAPGPETHFDVSLVGGSAVGMCATIPYGLGELCAFRARMGERMGVCWRTLVQSEGGRVVPMITVPARRARSVVLLTARHHACEAMASYVLEGAVHEFMRLRRNGDPVIQVSELIAVPMMDVDGVCEGDQGKGRSPWDHGRDYGQESRYKSVSALRSLLRQDDRPIFALDLHTPGLRGSAEELPYVATSGDARDLKRAQDVLTALISAEPDVARKPEILVFDQNWNSASSTSQRSCSAWLRSRPSTRLALAIEYPNAVDRGLPVLPTGARQFGAALLRSLIEVMR